MVHFLHGVSRIVLAVPRALLRLWQRSLWLRVTLTVLILSLLVVGVLGLSLLSRVTTGLLDAKERISVGEATAGLGEARRILDAAEGFQLGLVTRLSEDPLTEAMSVAGEIASRNPEAVRAAKRLLTTTAHAGFAEQFAAERREISALIGRPNQVEAITSNLESRPPVFSD